MVDAHVSTSIRVAIHFGKWVTSFVSLVVVLLKKEFDFNSDIKSLEKRTGDLVRKLVHMYMIFYKLRRRAWKIAAKTYPDLTESRDVRKNVALKRLIGRLEEAAGALDTAMSQHRRQIAIDDSLSQYAIALWRGMPNPPPLIKCEVLRWGFHELEEDAILKMDQSERWLRGEAPSPFRHRKEK